MWWLQNSLGYKWFSVHHEIPVSCLNYFMHFYQIYRKCMYKFKCTRIKFEYTRDLTASEFNFLALRVGMLKTLLGEIMSCGMSPVNYSDSDSREEYN